MAGKKKTIEERVAELENLDLGAFVDARIAAHAEERAAEIRKFISENGTFVLGRALMGPGKSTIRRAIAASVAVRAAAGAGARRMQEFIAARRKVRMNQNPEVVTEATPA